MTGSVLDRYAAFAFDLDGVIWRAGTIFPEAPPAIRTIQDAGKRLLFLTNNASYLPSWIVEHLAGAGITVGEEAVMTSAIAARSYIEHHGLVGKRAFVMGTTPVVDQIADLLEVVPVERGAKVDVVMVARDLAFSYDRLAAAADAVRHGALLLASNRDHVMPTVDGYEPGTGSVLAAIEAASGQRAIALGKPELPMMEAAVERIGRQGVLMTGDRTDSDVAGARQVGWDAAIVLTGVTKAGMPMDPAPDYVFPTLADLVGYRHSGNSR
ncbi:MAG TPA: HAD-IIA family hydrolase [Actinomycetota bacterium]|nr:HAD-IIA family hydrolase [Actinomycetota bacterium]